MGQEGTLAMEPLLNAGKTPVIPSMPGRRHPRPYDRDLFGARHLNRVISTRYDKRAVNFLAGVYAASISRLN
jgi:hypothetical protein